ncbi:MAG: hypothetical protein BAJALOKI1v1_2580003 [Promethearchaeota archaeon]|nr:MAG: hypothetical protein BAJALOKI1v1_2580003 [Candidatus Lokiarchaeota archaeon]
MHFLTKVIENSKLENPAEEHMDVHRHFNRYSRGSFSGPSLKMRAYSTKIVLKGSLEYEDIIQEIVVKTISEESIEVNGKVSSTQDISSTLDKLNLDWNLEETTGKTKKYKAEFKETISKDKLLEAIEAFREHSYLMLSFDKGKYTKVSTKKRLPRPSKKNPVEEDIDKKVSFCSGYVVNTQANMNLIISKLLPDFRSEIPKEWNQLILNNYYKIDAIEIPKNIKDSRLLRIMAIRKGKLIRSMEVDDITNEKQYTLSV